MEYNNTKALEFAVEIANQYNLDLGYDLETIKKIDFLIDKISNIKQELNEDILWNISVSLGTYLGEIMLENDLRNKGFIWKLNEESIPILFNHHSEMGLSPITKIYKIFLYGNDEGSAKDLFDSFYVLMEYYENKEYYDKNKTKYF